MEDDRSKLKTDGDDDCAQKNRDDYLRDPGKSRQARHFGQRVAASSSDQRQRDPVVRQDRVAKAHARRRRKSAQASCRSPAPAMRADQVHHGSIVLS